MGGALIGNGASGNTSYLGTGWATALTGTSWTIFILDLQHPLVGGGFNISGVTPAPGNFRCFTGGVRAGAGNWIMRGPFADVPVTGAASTGAVDDDVRLRLRRRPVPRICQWRARQHRRSGCRADNRWVRVQSGRQYNANPGLPNAGLMGQSSASTIALSPQPEILQLFTRHAFADALAGGGARRVCYGHHHDGRGTKTAFEHNANSLTQNPALGRSTGDLESSDPQRPGLRHRRRSGVAPDADMPKGAGGAASAPTPGVYGRAALGSCLAMGYTMYAAELGVPIDWASNRAASRLGRRRHLQAPARRCPATRRCAMW